LIRFSADPLGQDWGVNSFRGKDILVLPVRLHGIQLGRPIDLLLDRKELKVLGLDVRCGDGVHRFLPLPTAAIRDGEIAIASPLVMLEEDELAFYRSRALALTSLRKRPVQRRRRELGRLDDIVVRSDGTLQELVVAADGVEAQVPFDDSVRIVLESRSAA
jgi:hypothetical protein